MMRALAVARGASLRGTGGVLLVSGPPGFGKTALVAEVCRQSAALDLGIVGATCDEIEQVSPGAPIISLLRAGRLPLVDGTAYEQLAATASEPVLLAERIAEHLERAAAGRPLLVALDDLQWADNVSRFLLRTLVPRLAGLPIVWVLAGREISWAEDFEAGVSVRVEAFRLGPLTTADLIAIAHDRLGRIPDAHTRRFLAATAGDPVLAMRLIDNVARAMVRGESDSASAEFTASIAHRFTALSPAARELVGLVAIADRELTHNECDSLLGDRERTCGQALDAGLLVASERGFGFRHELVREAVRAAIGPKRGRDIHRQLARHYLAAGRPQLATAHARAAASPGDAAAAALLVATAESLREPAADEAGELASLAFQLLGVSQPEWLDLSRRCLAVLCRTERPREAIAVADAILAQSDCPDLVGEIETQAANALWLSGRSSDLRARTDRALRSGTVSPTVAARLRSAQALADARLLPGDVAVQKTATVLEHVRVDADREALELALQAAGVAADGEARHLQALQYYRELWSLGSIDHLPDEVIQLLLLDRDDQAEALLPQLRPAAASVLRAQMLMNFHLGELDGAEVRARALVELASHRGIQLYRLDAVAVRTAIALLREGPEAAAGTESETAVIGFGQRSLWPSWMGVFVGCDSHVTDDDAKAAVEAAQTSAERNPDVATFRGLALNLRGRRSGDLAMIGQSAILLASSPRALLRAGGAESWGRALLLAGHRSKGLEQLDRAWDEFHRMGAYHCRGLVQRTMRDAGARRAKWAATRSEADAPVLSPAESRVAALISAGHTNRSAAAELGVSINTVGTHLRAVFTKLGVQSRVQLANELHRPRSAA
jgi:DNA-binding CsgD family transcriptional regulator